MPTVGEQMTQVLSRVQNSIPGMKSAMVASSDGLLLASTSFSEENERTAAMSASLVSISRRASEAMGKPRLNDVTIRSEEGYITLFSVGRDAVLVISTTSEQKNLGMVYLEGKSASNELTEILKRSGL
ncbi:MAG: hypothetical protein GYA78_04370 [Caldisericales bacterium]|jgi:predicted regulator of Ras-like GTPase activity (Roadblock/LC7/MglB family)|nr:hypothetical protein [Caldisericales bacterium]